MPTPRSLAAIVLAATLISLTAGPPQPTTTTTDATLPLLIGRGKAPAAALLTRELTAPLPSTAGPLGQRAPAEPQQPHRTRPARFATPVAGTPRPKPPRAMTAAPKPVRRPRVHFAHAARTGPAPTRADHFRVGSITKTFIATVVLQLAAEHRLSLSDPVERHLPGLVRGPGADGRRITLRALLTHTSGLADFTAVTHGTPPPPPPPPRGGPHPPPPPRPPPPPVTPIRAVRTALARPASPKGRWAYSNTNYVLLGMVIEQVTGHTYATEAERRVLGPLRLTGTSFPGARTTLPSPHGRAYTRDGEDVTRLDPRVAGAAGEVISTLADLNRFYASLLTGRLLPAPFLREMLNTRTAHGRYGMGLYPYKLPCGTTVWGHNGHIAGSYVRTAATRDGRRVLTFRVNTDKLADPGLETALLAAEFCPRAAQRPSR
ncbi:serine hydrolase domain-containing protein [Streptomyces sp. NRRL S-920]|uniref:serine hydrolase domain-containing protein n=1 Tax=Streptomyces sp. NRRL S-920 TaxID=1463921 RepID=UPI00055A360E|nr:serine hydrolase domain-containing protein [Streptomyces sp. NRRL S-920]